LSNEKKRLRDERARALVCVSPNCYRRYNQPPDDQEESERENKRERQIRAADPKDFTSIEGEGKREGRVASSRELNPPRCLTEARSFILPR